MSVMCRCIMSNNCYKLQPKLGENAELFICIIKHELTMSPPMLNQAGPSR